MSEELGFLLIVFQQHAVSISYYPGERDNEDHQTNTHNSNNNNYKYSKIIEEWSIFRNSSAAASLYLAFHWSNRLNSQAEKPSYPTRADIFRAINFSYDTEMIRWDQTASGELGAKWYCSWFYLPLLKSMINCLIHQTSNCSVCSRRQYHKCRYKTLI